MICPHVFLKTKGTLFGSWINRQSLPVSTANGKSMKRKNPKVLQRQRKLHRVAAKRQNHPVLLRQVIAQSQAVPKNKNLHRVKSKKFLHQA